MSTAYDELLASDVWALLPDNSTSIKLESSRVVKAGQGVCFGAIVHNSNAAAQFVLVFDTVGPLANGLVPATIVSVPGVTTGFVDYGIRGRRFREGIVFANSSTGPTLTLGAADCWFDVQYL